MDAGLVVAVTLALAFAFTNGFQDASNAIATLVATRAARPGPALALATGCFLVGPFFLGAAVANTIAGIIDVDPADTAAVVSAALLAALLWNLATCTAVFPRARATPSSAAWRERRSLTRGSTRSTGRGSTATGRWA